MKYLLVLISLVSFAACNSEKAVDTAATDSVATETTTTTTTTDCTQNADGTSNCGTEEAAAE